MTGSRSRASFALISTLALPLALAACAGYSPSTPSYEQPPPPAAALPPPNINPGDFVGRYGLAAYHKEGDRARTEVAARGQCNNAYVIGRGPSGGLMMHIADAREPQELRFKAGGDGKVYLGPEGPAADTKDRELVGFDGRVLVLRWVDPEVAARYGTMVYVRCGAPGAPPPSAKR